MGYLYRSILWLQSNVWRLLQYNVHLGVQFYRNKTKQHVNKNDRNTGISSQNKELITNDSWLCTIKRLELKTRDYITFPCNYCSRHFLFKYNNMYVNTVHNSTLKFLHVVQIIKWIVVIFCRYFVFKYQRLYNPSL